jgi:hypothetical protein
MVGQGDLFIHSSRLEPTLFTSAFQINLPSYDFYKVCCIFRQLFLQREKNFVHEETQTTVHRGRAADRLILDRQIYLAEVSSLPEHADDARHTALVLASPLRSQHTRVTFT